MTADMDPFEGYTPPSQGHVANCGQAHYHCPVCGRLDVHLDDVALELSEAAAVCFRCQEKRRDASDEA